MAWTSPRTAAPQQVFTAGDWNDYIRDNLLETMPALATTDGALYLTDDVNSLVERYPSTAADAGGEAEVTTGGAFAHPDNAGTVGNGPVVTVTTGSKALVIWSARIRCATAGVVPQCSIRVTGSTSVTASENWMLAYETTIASASTDQAFHGSMSHMFTGLTPGSNSFTLLFNRSGAAGTARFAFRQVTVIPL
jgi:hypothetical protein